MVLPQRVEQDELGPCGQLYTNALSTTRGAAEDGKKQTEAGQCGMGEKLHLKSGAGIHYLPVNAFYVTGNRGHALRPSRATAIKPDTFATANETPLRLRSLGTPGMGRG
jgi:hypothetical protein